MCHRGGSWCGISLVKYRDDFVDECRLAEHNGSRLSVSPYCDADNEFRFTQRSDLPGGFEL